jgi:hypothetical protein
MGQSPYWETNNCSARQEILRLLRKSNVHYRAQNSLPLDPILRKMNPGKISGSHAAEYENGCLLGCCAVKFCRNWPTFQRCLLPRRPDDGSRFMFWRRDDRRCDVNTQTQCCQVARVVSNNIPRPVFAFFGMCRRRNDRRCDARRRFASVLSCSIRMFVFASFRILGRRRNDRRRVVKHPDDYKNIGHNHGSLSWVRVPVRMLS